MCILEWLMTYYLIWDSTSLFLNFTTLFTVLYTRLIPLQADIAYTAITCKLLARNNLFGIFFLFESEICINNITQNICILQETMIILNSWVWQLLVRLIAVGIVFINFNDQSYFSYFDTFFRWKCCLWLDKRYHWLWKMFVKKLGRTWTQHLMHI